MSARKRKKGPANRKASQGTPQSTPATAGGGPRGEERASPRPERGTARGSADGDAEAGIWGGGDPRVKPRRAALRWGLNLWITALMLLFTIDALPNSIPGLQRLNEALDTVYDVSGLAQGEWKLFSPDPDHINAYVEATITYSDGSTRTWTTPEWRERSLIMKFFHGRHPKFSDAFRMDRNKVIWPHLADWILAQVTPPEGARPEKVELMRYWWEVPKPADLPEDAAKYEHMPPHREEYTSKYSFFTKEYE